MAEELTFLPAGVTSGGIPLHDGDWQIEALDLGTPGVRDELVSSADTDGAVPFRVGKREAVEWSARIRLVPQSSKDAVIGKLRELEGALASAEAAAARGVTDPGVDAARLLWRPGGATSTGILPLIRAEIQERPIERQGDNIGWFLNHPVITIGGLRDPFIWGDLAQVASGTASGGPLAQVLDLPAIGGSVPPWLKVTLEETAGQPRNQLTAGLEVPSQAGIAGGAPLIVPASQLDTDGYAGTISGGRLSCTSTEWVGAAATFAALHSGSYRVVGALVKGAGSIRLRWGKVGEATTLNLERQSDHGTFRDLDLGVIDVTGDGWWFATVETTGTVTVAGLMLVPIATWVTAETPPGSSALSAKVVDGNLTGSGTLSGAPLALPGGQTWGVTGTWTRQAGYVERTAVSESSRQIALAGTSTYSGVRVSCDFTVSLYNAAQDITSQMGVLARWTDVNNHAYAGLHRILVNGQWQYALVASAYVGGVMVPLYGAPQTFTEPGQIPILAAGWPWVRVAFQVDTQGYWQLLYGFSGPDQPISERVIAAGQHPALAAGGALATGRVGIYDRWSQAVAQSRRFRGFVAHGARTGATPMLPAGKSLEITPDGMVTVDGAIRRRVSHRGGVFQPPPDQPSRLLVASRRFNGLATTESEGKTDNQKVTVEARRRWLQVP